MLKLKILDKNNEVIRAGKFETSEKLNEYIQKLNKNGIVGLKPERPELIMNEETKEMVETGVILPADFIIQIEDISAQLEQEKINAEAKKFLSETDWKCQRHSDQKALGVSSSLSEEEFQSLLLARQEARNRII